MKLKIWLNSGANAFSTYEVIVDTQEYGIEDAEWCSMSEREKEDFAKDIAFEKADWGYTYEKD